MSSFSYWRKRAIWAGVPMFVIGYFVNYLNYRQGGASLVPEGWRGWLFALPLLIAVFVGCLDWVSKFFEDTPGQKVMDRIDSASAKYKTEG